MSPQLMVWACICRYVQQVSKGATDAAKAHGLAASATERRKKKEAEEAAAREMAAMFAPAIKQPKAPPGVVLSLASLRLTGRAGRSAAVSALLRRSRASGTVARADMKLGWSHVRMA